jgi:hypothetical protein
MKLFKPPVREFDGRKSLRSIADALEKLRELDGLSDQETVEIQVGPFQLRDGRRTATVAVVRPRRADGSIFVVLMPSSQGFSALATQVGRMSYTIDVLDEAKCDAVGNVELSNGGFVHGVVLKPAPFPKFNKTEERIVRLALQFLNVEDRCYSKIAPDVLPDVEVLDYRFVADVRIERLKPVQAYVLSRLTGLSTALSPSVVSSALRRAGMRLPRSKR